MVQSVASLRSWLWVGRFVLLHFPLTFPSPLFRFFSSLLVPCTLNTPHTDFVHSFVDAPNTTLPERNEQAVCVGTTKMRGGKRRTKRPLSPSADEARLEAFSPNVRAPKARRSLGVSFDTTPLPQLRRTTGGRRRRRSSSIVRTAATALTLAVLVSLPAPSLGIDSSPGASAAHAPSASNPGINHKKKDGTTTTSHSSRLCTPPERARAYVTTLASDSGGEAGGRGNGGVSDAALGPRVLAQSLRSAGAKGDIVVLVPLDRYTGTSVDALRRDGLTVHIVPRGLQSGGLCSLYFYQDFWSRVIFLDHLAGIETLLGCRGSERSQGKTATRYLG